MSNLVENITYQSLGCDVKFEFEFGFESGSGDSCVGGVGIVSISENMGEWRNNSTATVYIVSSDGIAARHAYWSLTMTRHR